MARQASGPRIIRRGQCGSIYAVFADGSGKKVFARIIDEAGNLLPPETPDIEALPHAWRIFAERRREAAGQTQPITIRTVGELTDRHVDRNLAEWSESTMKRYLVYLDALEAELGPSIPLDCIDLECAENCVASACQKYSWATGTEHRFISFCTAVFGYGQKLGWITANVFALVRRPTVQHDRVKEPFTHDEIRSLLETARLNYPWFYPALVVLVCTGGRRAEVCALQVENYCPDTGVITFPAPITKCKKGNRVLLPLFARDVMKSLVCGRLGSEPLFRKRSGKALTPKDFDLSWKPGQSRRIWRKVLESAGVAIRGVHGLRAALITNLVEDGYTLEQATGVTGQTMQIAEQSYLRRRLEGQCAVSDHLEMKYGATAPGRARYP